MLLDAIVRNNGAGGLAMYAVPRQELRVQEMTQDTNSLPKCAAVLVLAAAAGILAEGAWAGDALAPSDELLTRDARLDALTAQVRALQEEVKQLRAGGDESWLTDRRADEIKSLLAGEWSRHSHWRTSPGVNFLGYSDTELPQSCITIEVIHPQERSMPAPRRRLHKRFSTVKDHRSDIKEMSP